MTLIERLKRYFGNLYDADFDVCDGSVKVTINKAGRIWKMFDNEDNPDIDLLYEADEFFTDMELFLTDEERELKAEVNKHICEHLMQKEYE